MPQKYSAAAATAAPLTNTPPQGRARTPDIYAPLLSPFFSLLSSQPFRRYHSFSTAVNSRPVVNKSHHRARFHTERRQQQQWRTKLAKRCRKRMPWASLLLGFQLSVDFCKMIHLKHSNPGSNVLQFSSYGSVDRF